MASDKTTPINKLKIEYQKFLDERNWMQYQDPKSVAGSIAIEAAELLELFQWDDRKAGAKKITDPEWRDKIRMELADILSYTLVFAIQADIDLSEAFTEKLEKVKKKFPAELVRKDLKAYRRIKEEYRKSGKS